MRLLPIAAAAALLSSAGGAGAADGGLAVHDAWMRALPNHLPAAGYFTLENRGDAARDLVGASSPACGGLMLHRSRTRGGVARMEMVPHVPVPAHGKVAFAPGGYHLMCTKPSAEVAPGRRVPVVLRFGDGASLQADFPVRGAAGR